jgi:hypothetical protein
LKTDILTAKGFNTRHWHLPCKSLIGICKVSLIPQGLKIGFFAQKVARHRIELRSLTL